MSGTPFDPRSESPTLTRAVGFGHTHTHPPTSHGSLQAGRIFGPYLIHRLLGKGGMGEVYEAQQRESGRRVALKVLAEPNPLPHARERFLREGRLAAAVNHPNSVYIYGTEEIEGQWAISMELVAGGSLKDRMREQGPFPPQLAVDAILQVVDGLDAAARAGVLHRDIKPANCFVGLDGTVKVGDFGLSLSTLARDQSRSHLTKTGTFMGTPAFASPEQLRGHALDVRSDIYSVGATLYYLLTGRPPFEADNLMQLLTTIAEKPAPSPRVLQPKIPRGLASVVLQCLAKKAERRPQDYDTLYNRLKPFGVLTEAPQAWALHPFAIAVNGVLSWALASAIIRLADVAEPALRQDVIALLAAGLGAAVVLSPLLLAGWEPLGERLFGIRVLDSHGAEPHPMARFLRFLVTAALLVFSAMAFQVGYVGVALHVLLGPSVVVFFLDLRPVRPASARSRGGTVQALEADASGPSIGPFKTIEGCDDAEAVVRAFDPVLRRQVWVLRTLDGAIPATPERATRLRQIAAGRDSLGPWAAFEAPVGRALSDIGPLPWSIARGLARDLATEIEVAFAEGSLPKQLSLDRVWLSEPRTLRLLDFSPPGVSNRPSLPMQSERDVLLLLAAAIRRMVALPAQPLFVPRNVTRFLQDIESGEIAFLKDAALMLEMLARGTVDGGLARATHHPGVGLLVAILPMLAVRHWSFWGYMLAFAVLWRLRSEFGGRDKGWNFHGPRHLVRRDGTEATAMVSLGRDALAILPLIIAVVIAVVLPEWLWASTAGLVLVVAFQVLGAKVDGLGPLGRITGTRWVPAHLPFGEVRNLYFSTTYEELRDTLLSAEFRKLDPRSEKDWRRFEYAANAGARSRAPFASMRAAGRPERR